MTKLCVLTTTRADYGIYFWLLKDILANPKFQLQLVVSGTHLEADYGTTINEIRKDAIPIAKELKIFDSNKNERTPLVAMSKMQLGFYDTLTELNPDFVILLGDRFEMAAAALAAVMAKKPIIHLHGGEVTLGAIDDCLRHAITKLSYLHLTSTEDYRQRVIRLGESPDRVFTVGAPGLDHIKRQNLLSKADLEKFLGLSLERTSLLITFHPTTLENLNPLEQINQLLMALDEFKDLQIIFTLPNADPGRWEIANRIEQWTKENSNRAKAFHSLGHLRYLAAIKYASAVVGNSSSGIIEAPSFGTPTLNIGIRQKGRVQSKTTLNCDANKDAIIAGLKKVLDSTWQAAVKNSPNPYGDGHSSERIMQILGKLKKPENLVKEFYEGLA